MKGGVGVAISRESEGCDAGAGSGFALAFVDCRDDAAASALGGWEPPETALVSASNNDED